jgi:hypothetical protein
MWIRRPRTLLWVFEAYERALARESEYPNVRTQAVINLPFLIAAGRMKRRYYAAIDLIRRSSKDPII